MIDSARSSAKFVRLKRGIRSLMPEGIPVDVETICIGLLESLWHFGIRNCPRGDIGKFDDEVISESVGWLASPSALISLLIECGWLDIHAEHRLVIHDWHEHAPGFIKRNIGKRGGFVSVPPSITEVAALSSEPLQAAPAIELKCSTEHGSPSLSAPRSTEATTPNLTKPNLTKANPTQPDSRRELVEDVSSLGVGMAEEAVRLAVEKLQLSTDEIRNRICDFRNKASPKERQPGTLYHWLTRHGSYEASRATWQQLRKPIRLDPTVQRNNRLAIEVRRMKQSGVTLEEIERYINQFEQVHREAG